MGRYLAKLSESSAVRPLLPHDVSGDNSYWLFAVRTERRDDLMTFLTANDVATGVHYTPLTVHPVFRKYASPVPNALAIYDRMMTLPLFADIEETEVDYVCEKIAAFTKL